MPLLRQVDAWLEQAVLSAVTQTVPVEVIVITSPLTPESNLRVLAGLAQRFQNLRIAQRPDGKRFAGALNHGIALASADRIGFLLTDDWLAPDCVEKCLAADADIVSTAMDFYASDGVTELTRLRRSGLTERYLACANDFERASFLEHFFLLRREAVLLAGGVDETLGDSPGVDDLDLIWTLLERGATVHLLDEPLYHYRDHAGERLTTRKGEEMRETYTRILRKHGLAGTELEECVENAARWFGQPVSVVFEALHPPVPEAKKAPARPDLLYPLRWIYRRILPLESRHSIHNFVMKQRGYRQ